MREVGVFIRGSVSDARLRRHFDAGATSAEAFDGLYGWDIDPWRSAAPEYRYQAKKYRQMMALLPERRFARALDLGCGVGLFLPSLAARADAVVGVDVSEVALGAARARCAGLPNVSFAQGDITQDAAWGEAGGFDLIVLADTLYYLPTPIPDTTIKAVAQRIATALRPGGSLLLVNQYFTPWDADSRFTRRIRDGFAWSALLEPVRERTHRFWLGSVFSRA